MAVNTLESFRERYTGRLILRWVKEFYADKQNKADFEKWYQERYGQPYVPKEVNYEN